MEIPGADISASTSIVINQFILSTRPSKIIFVVLDVWIGRSYTLL